MEQKTKKVYPSEINTKAIACRIPYEDYSKIINKCIQSQIKVSDWLLALIYEKTNTSTIHGEIAGSSSDTTFPFSITFGELVEYVCDRNEEHYDETVSKMRNTINRLFESDNKERKYHHRNNDVIFEFTTIEELLSSFMNVMTQYLLVHDSWINGDMKNKKPKTPNLLDAKVQIQAIAKDKFSGNDFRAFIKDLNLLLSELE